MGARPAGRYSLSGRESCIRSLSSNFLRSSTIRLLKTSATASSHPSRSRPWERVKGSNRSWRAPIIGLRCVQPGDMGTHSTTTRWRAYVGKCLLELW